MNQNPSRRTGIISTSSLNQIAIYRKLFPKHTFDLYMELYRDMPEDTISDKIIRLRYMHHLERYEFAAILDLHEDTIKDWEINNIMPHPQNIRKICENFNIPLKYFHEYYNIYFNKPGEAIKKWKEKKGLTYSKACKLLNISHSGFARLLKGKIKLSYEMYLKLKVLKVF